MTYRMLSQQEVSDKLVFEGDEFECEGGLWRELTRKEHKQFLRGLFAPTRVRRQVLDVTIISKSNRLVIA